MRAWATRHRFELIVFGLVYVVMAVIGVLKPGDTDEGFYATAAELVGKGRLPYRDFFYPQAPLLPYLLAPVALVAPSFVALRLVMAAFPAATCVLVARTVRQETHSLRGGAVGALLVVAHELGWQWLGAIKTYGPSTFFATAAVVVVSSSRFDRPYARAAAAGALAMTAVGMRLMLAPVLLGCIAAVMLRDAHAPFARAVLALLAGIWLVRWGSLVPWRAAMAIAAASIAVLGAGNVVRRVGLAAAVVGGAAVIGTLALLFWRPDKAAFAFDNIGYHAHRADGGLLAPAGKNLNLFRQLLGLAQEADLSVAAPQWVFLYVLNGVAIARSPIRGLRVGPVVTAVLLAVVCLLPNPAHEQYFVTLVPFLAIGAGVGFSHVARGGLLGQKAITAVACVVAYVALAEPSLEAKVVHGRFGGWDMNAARPLLLDDAAREVRREAARKAGPILPAWPGSALGVADRITSGYENQFARDIASRLEEAERKQRRLFTTDDLSAEVASRRPAIVVVDRGIVGDEAKALRQKLALCGYDPVGAIHADAEIYERNEAVTECKPAPPAKK